MRWLYESYRHQSQEQIQKAAHYRRAEELKQERKRQPQPRKHPDAL